MFPPPPDLGSWSSGAVAVSMHTASRMHGLSRFPALIGSSLAVVLEGSIERWDARMLRWNRLPSAFLMGPQTRPFTSRHSGTLRCVSLFVHPTALTAFAGDDAFRLTDQEIDAFDLWGMQWQQARARIHDANAPAVQASLLFAFMREVAGRRDVSMRLRHAEQLREVIMGPLADAARNLAITPRQLQRRCSDQLGMTPKRFQRIVRIEHTLRHALTTGCADTELALRHGYYDQAHLGRELRDLVGEPITAILREVELPGSAYWPLRLAMPRYTTSACMHT